MQEGAPTAPRRPLFGPRSHATLLSRWTEGLLNTYVVLALIGLLMGLYMSIAYGRPPLRPRVVWDVSPNRLTEAVPRDALVFHPREVGLELSWGEAPLLLSFLALQAILGIGLVYLVLRTVHEFALGMAKRGPFSERAGLWIRRLGLVLLCYPLATYFLTLAAFPALDAQVERLNLLGAHLELPPDLLFPGFMTLLLIPLGFQIWLLGGLVAHGTLLQQHLRETV